MDISRVQLQGLQAAQHLNGAIGVVVGDPDAETGRIPVKLLGELGKSMPHGIKVKPSNISHLPRQTGVQLKGTQAQEVSLTQQQSRTLSSGSWISCQVPTLLGIPMAMKQLAPTTQATRLQWECAAVYMLVDPNSGFAPGWVQMNGRGEVLLARTDGEASGLQVDLPNSSSTSGDGGTLLLLQQLYTNCFGTAGLAVLAQ